MVVRVARNDLTSFTRAEGAGGGGETKERHSRTRHLGDVLPRMISKTLEDIVP